MKQMTIEEKVELLKEKVGNGIFQRRDCYRITSVETLKKYGYIEEADSEEIEELSLEDVVDLLNMLDGEDNYYEFDKNDWSEYKLINNKVCIVNHIHGYRFIK